MREHFEHIYGSHGDWAQLFRKGDGFLSTQLYRDVKNDGHYITIDSFTSKAAFEKILEQFKNEYDVLDRRCETLTTSERCIGEIET